MKRLIACISFLFLTTAVFSQMITIAANPVITMFPMLQTDFDIRNIGFGNISAVNPSHSFTSRSLTNPSLLVAGDKQWSNYLNVHQYDQNEYSLSYQAASKIGNRFSLGLMGRNYSNTFEYVDSQNIVQNIQTKVATIGIFGGYRINNHWSVGAGVNYFNHSLSNLNAQSYFFDLGVNYQTTFKLPKSQKLILQAGLKANYLGPKPYDYEFLPSNLALATALTHLLLLNGGTLYTTFGYQVEKLLVPTSTFLDANTNGVEDSRELSATEGIIASFSDAPDGLSEEFMEITHKFGLEFSYTKNGWTRGIRGGFFNIPAYKGGLKYRSFGASIGKNGYLLNFSYQHFSNGDPDVEVRDVLSLGASINI